MINLFEEQVRQRKLMEEKNRQKCDSALEEKIQIQNRRENSREIPFSNDLTRNDLINTFEKCYGRKYKNYVRIHDEALTKEIDKKKVESESDAKKRQLLWETSPELRELRKQLLMADVARDQAMQLAEKQALAELKKEEEESLAALAEEENKKYEQEQKRKEELEFQAKLKYHKDLDDLREFKASKQDVDEEQLEKEKAAIDVIKRQIEEENKESERKKIEAQRELQSQATELQKARQDMEMREKQKERDVEMRADEYRKAQELRAKQQEEERHFNLNQKLQVQEELLSCLEKIYAEKSKEELLWTELGIEERDAMEKQKATAAAERQKAVREELQKLYDMQMRVKKQKDDLRKKEEELFRQNLMAKLYEEEKLEHMTQQKRHLKQAEHRRLAQELIEENRRRKATEQAKEMADHKFLKEQEAERGRLVEEERKKFLSEHAKELLGYLPKRVFRDQQEVEHLGHEFKKFYSRRNYSTIYQPDS